MPVLALLRRQYPEIKITVLTTKFLQPFFREVADVSFFAPDLKGRHKGVKGIWTMSRDLGRFDLVADLHDVLRSKGLRKLMRLKGSRVAYINKGQKEKKALTAPEKKIKVQLKTTVERYRDVFLKLGFDLPPVPLPERIRYPMSEDRPGNWRAPGEAVDRRVALRSAPRQDLSARDDGARDRPVV